MTQAYDIQAVIFDVGGVLDRPADLAAEEADRIQIAASLGLDLMEMWARFFQTEPWQLCRVGRITDAEFWDRNLSSFGIRGPAEQAAFLEHLFRHKEVNPAMRALLDDLHGRVRLAIISNASDTLEEGLTHRFRIMPLFDVVVNSARVGYAKPAREIFEIALERLGLRPEQTAFTDDQQHNVDAAAELDMHAALFTGAEDFRAFLAQRGVLPR